MPLDRLGYRPALDGIRAVAILLVLGLHGRVLPGGFLGVDLFFVLSGFLITALLVGEAAETGTIALRRFYVRRARRLLPALAVLVLAVGAIYLSLPHVHRGLGYWVSVAAVAGYGANWLAALTSAANPGPLGLLGHTWSLGIEEQFYLLWPLVLLLLVHRRCPRRVLGVALLAGAVASAVDAVRVARRNYDVAFLRTDTHAFGLLLGCAAFVLVLDPRSSRLRPLLRSRPAGVVAALALAVAVARLRHGDSTWWLAAWPLASLAAAMLVLHVVLAPRALAARALSLRPLVWLGVRSYGVYLYHFPIFFAVAPETVGLGKYSLLAITAPLSVLAAVVSYTFVERPLLRPTQYPRVAERAAQALSSGRVAAGVRPPSR